MQTSARYAYCLNEVDDVDCADYPAYKAKKELDAKCLNEVEDEDCVGYPAYDEAEAKRQLDAKCLNEVEDEECADYPAYKAKKELDEKCLNEVEDEDCADYPAYKAKKELDALCSYSRADVCAGYPVYEKWKLNRYCADETTDEKCAGYPAYDTAEARRKLNEKCATDTTDPSCKGYPVYDAAEVQRQLDAYCETNTTDLKCAGYDAYKAKKALDEKCADEVEDEACAGYPAYDEANAVSIARANTFWKYRPDTDVTGKGVGRDIFHYYKTSNPKASLEVCLNTCTDYGDICGGVVFNKNGELCWGKQKTDVTSKATKGNTDRILYEKTSDPNDIKQPWKFCSEKINLSDPYCKPQLDAKCLNEVDDDICAGYLAYDEAEAKRQLDKKCATNTMDEECVGYDAYDKAKKELDEKCLNEVDDDICAGYPAYDEAEAKRQLDAKCLNEVEDEECTGYLAYDEAEAKRQLDAKCLNEVEDEECADYPAYKAKKKLDAKCLNEVEDEECAGYPAYDEAEAKRQLDAKCLNEVEDEECADYPAYKAKRQLDAKCLNEVEDEDCADYPAYKAKKELDAKCLNEVEDEDCVGYPAYDKAKKELDAKCLNEVEDEDCAGYPAYEAKKRSENAFWNFKPGYDVYGGDTFHYYKTSYPKANLEVCLRKCNDQGDDCAGVVFDENEELCWGKSSTIFTFESSNESRWGVVRNLYEKTSDPADIKEPWNFCSEKINLSHPYCKPQLDAKCLNEVEDEDCADYPAYKAKKELDKKCLNEVEDEDCAGYPAYEAAAEAARKKELDAKCLNEVEDEECADYPAYKAKRQLDAKCATNTTDPECADYVAYKAERLCGSDDSIRDPLCFIRMCLKKDAPSICEENPERIRIRSIADEIDDEILTELCKDSKDSNGYFKWYTPSACRTVGTRCGGRAKYGKCPGDQCCDRYNRCSGTTGGTTGGPYTYYCRYPDGKGGYTGRYSGKFDGDASRQEEDKIARRPANFLDMVYQRTTTFCDIPANVLDPTCGDYDLAMSIVDEIDDEILTEFCKDSKDGNGNFKTDAPSACRTTGGRCGSQTLPRGGKCRGDACCSHANWCGGTTGGQKTDHCRNYDGKGGYIGRDEGRFDGDASRQEEDKIARRPDDFLDTVYQRVQERKAS